MRVGGRWWVGREQRRGRIISTGLSRGRGLAGEDWRVGEKSWCFWIRRRCLRWRCIWDFEPQKEMRGFSPLSKQLRHCWVRYVRGKEEVSLGKGREAARKAGVDLRKGTPPGLERLQFRWLPTRGNGKYLEWKGSPVFRPWWRYCAVVRAPWFNDKKDKMGVEWDLLCSTCVHPDRRWERNPAPPSTPDGHFCEFTVES